MHYIKVRLSPQKATFLINFRQVSLERGKGICYPCHLFISFWTAPEQLLSHDDGDSSFPANEIKALLDFAKNTVKLYFKMVKVFEVQASFMLIFNLSQKSG